MTEFYLPDKDDVPWLDCMDGFKSPEELLETLDQATVTCADCGDKYGVHSVRYSSWWNGKCHVCNEEKPVTEARDFAYFFTTRKKLSSNPTESK